MALWDNIDILAFERRPHNNSKPYSLQVHCGGMACLIDLTQQDVIKLQQEMAAAFGARPMVGGDIGEPEAAEDVDDIF